jgi:hypothetical protein
VRSYELSWLLWSGVTLLVLMGYVIDVQDPLGLSMTFGQHMFWQKDKVAQ